MRKKIVFFFYLLLVSGLILPGLVSGAFLYKSYLVRQDRGNDILCDPYIVQKNDYVIKLFKQRGQIAEQDFPEFLSIFRRLNPHIKDANKIRPGQHMLIPLKKLTADALPGQSSGVVTIPFVTISKLSDMIVSNSFQYTVKSGDYVSRIISGTYGKTGTLSYNEGIQLFKLINPGLKNINRIYPGQVLNIPKPTLQNKRWYASLFDSSGKLNTDIDEPPDTPPKEKPKTTIVEKPKPEPDVEEETKKESPFVKAASFLDAEFRIKGSYHFPRPGKDDFILDVSKHPMMELNNGTRIIFSDNQQFSSSDRAAMESHWKSLKFIPLPLQSTFEQIIETVFKSEKKYDVKNQLTFEDQGVVIDIRAKWIIKSSVQDENQEAEYTCFFQIDNDTSFISDPLKIYLKDRNIATKEINQEGVLLSPSIQAQNTTSDQKITGTPFEQSIHVSPVQNAPWEKEILYDQENLKAFVHNFTTSMGYRYSENASISFPYAGLQISALSNLIFTDKGEQLIVDYGDLYGDAISTIKKSGLNIIQLDLEQNWSTTVKTIMEALTIPHIDQPLFFAAPETGDMNIVINIPGILIKPNPEKHILLTQVALHPELIRFAKEKGNQVMIITGKHEYELTEYDLTESESSESKPDREIREETVKERPIPLVPSENTIDSNKMEVSP